MVFNGSNPLSVQRVQKLDQLEPEMRDLKIEGHHLQYYIDKKHLYFQDTSYIKPYQYPMQHNGMHIHAPQTLLYLNAEGKILPTAIHFSDGKKTRVIRPEDNLPNTWLLAKIHANCADMQGF
jgi:hypothetical protein